MKKKKKYEIIDARIEEKETADKHAHRHSSLQSRFLGIVCACARENKKKKTKIQTDTSRRQKHTHTHAQIHT